MTNQLRIPNEPGKPRPSAQRALADGLAARRFFVRRTPNEPYQMWRAADASFTAFSLSDPYANSNALADALAENVESL